MSRGICQSGWIVSTNNAGLSRDGCIACVSEVDYARRARLLRCDPEIGVDCALVSYGYGGVGLAVPQKQNAANSIRHRKT